MNNHIVFFSDAHLSVSRPARTRHLLDFFGSTEFQSSPIVYILGDLFDFWIGPKHLELVDYQEVLSALKARTEAGQKIYFIYGNRDFLVDKAFTSATGVKILGDSAKIKAGQKSLWLTHGDLLCTLDKGYQSYRRLARSQLIKSAYRSIPQKTSYGIGKGLRALSTNLVSRKTDVERNISGKAVESAFKKGYDIIICGHVHKSGHEVWPGDKQLFTLSSFGEEGHYLIYKDGIFQPRQCQD
jgi:UDP-2,3-diacylglucosamine hydrolase